MRKPAVACRTVPVLYVRRNRDNRTRRHRHRLFTRLLIPAASAYANQQLPTASCRPVNVPVVAAARLERYVIHGKRSCGNFRKITVPRKVFRISSIRISDRKEKRILIAFFFSRFRHRFVPYVLCQAKSRPTLRPACVHCRMSDDRSNLRLGYAVFFLHSANDAKEMCL